MKEIKPKFLLTRIYDDGTQETPQVVPLLQGLKEVKVSRRGFFGAGLTASAAVVWLNGCEDTGIEMEPEEPNAELPDSAPVEGIVNCVDVFAHVKSVTSLAVSPDGKWFFSAGDDNAIKMWSLPEGALVRSWYEKKVNSLVVSNDGKYLISGSENSIRFWSLPEGTLVKELSEKKVQSLIISPDGQKLISGCIGAENMDNIKVWNLPEGSFNKSVFHDDDVISLAATLDGHYFVSSGLDRTVSLLNLPAGKLLKVWRNNNSNVASLAITPNEQRLLSGDNNGNIKLRTLPDGTTLKMINAHDGSVNALAVTPNGRQLFSAGSDKTIKQWSLPGVNLEKTFKQDDIVHAMVISPDGKFLISSNNDKTIKLWSLPEVELIHCMLDLRCSVVEGTTYNVTIDGRTVTYTLPCGSPISAGAKCICNCVPGSGCTTNMPVCTCEAYTICTCDSVCTCQSYSPCTCDSVCSCQSYGSVCTCNKVCVCAPT